MKKSLNKKIRHPIKKIVIVFRKDTELAQKKATELARWLIEKKLQVFSHPNQTLTIKSQSKKIPKAKSLSSMDLVIVLGGDGTYLEAVRMLENQQVPILGINMGSLGFLTHVQVDRMYEEVEKTLKLKMQMRPRAMLDVKVKSKGKIIAQHRALNDIVIERGSNSHLTHFSVFVGEQLISSIKADGVIIATPTGSTAYNLAAGGPILHPETNGIVVTPICAHSLTHRPTILPDHLTMSFKLNDPARSAFLTVDGVHRGEISGHDEIIVEKCECVHYVLRDPSHNYFNLLREKLKFGERA